MILLAGAAFTAVSCVKEDRTPCPCWLDVYLGEDISKEISLCVWQNSDKLLSEDLSEDMFSPFVEREVRRGFNQLTAFEKKGTLSSNGSRVSISKGHECDSLYACSNQVNCTGEFAVDTIRFHKQFATLYLQVLNPSSVDYPYDLTVTGKVCGLDLSTLRPVDGDFSFTPVLNEEFLGTCRLPRQKDNSLTIEMTKTEDGSHVDTIQLGELIAATGFDWKAADLNDIVIKIDFAKADISVTVNEWHSDYTYEIEI